MDAKVVDHIDAIAAPAWNALAGHDNPFLRHELLSAFERSGCAVAATGWRAQHLAVYDGAHLVGAAPLYLKSHTYGEFVFDFAWAEAYRRAGLRYYPKLISAIPFSPVTGPRLLIGTTSGPRAEEIARLLIDGAVDVAARAEASSVHWLFPDENDLQRLEGQRMLRRDGFQYHWLNPGYRDFEDFLSTFNAHKRKKTKRERRHVAEAGVTIEVLEGRAITAAHWDVMHDFHQATIRQYGAPPFLTRAFFHALAESMPEYAMMVFARHGREYVGGAFNLVGADALYGRYWGGRPGYNSLHFEVCYYSAIDYCIAKGLKRFEGGAGGEHKLARGFVPVATHSAHWLRHPQFARAVAEFLARERGGLELYLDELNEHTPFKKTGSGRATAG
jgi:predicted N-acyltransferase